MQYDKAYKALKLILIYENKLSIFFFFVTYQKKMLKKQLELNEIRARQQEEILQKQIDRSVNQN